MTDEFKPGVREFAVFVAVLAISAVGAAVLEGDAGTVVTFGRAVVPVLVAAGLAVAIVNWLP